MSHGWLTDGSRMSRRRSTIRRRSQVGQPLTNSANRPDTLLFVSALRAALVAVSAAVLTAACAAGQQAQTAQERPSIDGTTGVIGQLQLEGVALHAPTGIRAYPAGSAVAMKLYIVNNGQSGDTLTNVTSSAFTGWQVVSTPAVPAATATGGGSESGTPQQIGPGAAIGLGLTNLTPGGTGSAETLVLTGLKTSSAPLYPGSAVPVTFTFANAGQTTLTVPVQVSAQPNSQTLAPSLSPAP